MWQNRDNLYTPSADRPGNNGSSFFKVSAYAEENNKDVMYLITGSDLYKYTVTDVNDPTTDTYELVGFSSGRFWLPEGSAGYSQERNLFVRVGKDASHYFTYWQPDAENPSDRTFFEPIVENNATFPFEDLWQYGIDYDPLRERFVLWNGNDVWALTPPDDLLGENWLLSLLLDDTSIDGPHHIWPSSAGVLGSWKYIEELDIFLGLTDGESGDIWAYKPDNWQPNLVPIPGALILFSSGLLLIIGNFSRKTISPQTRN